MSETTLNASKKKDLHLIDPRAITFDPENNPRQFYGTEQEWKEHKQSIKENGVKVPVSIQRTKDGIRLIHGYRRMKAVMELIEEGVDIKLVPCVAVEKGYNEEKELLDHLTLNAGLPLTPMEEAIAFQRLIAHGWTQKQIAQKVAKTQGAISNTLKLADLPMKVQNYIHEKLVASTLVMKLIKEHKDVDTVAKMLTNHIERLDGSKQKVTEATITVQRVSKYHKRFSGSIEILRERKVSESKISKVEAIMEALDCETNEELADKLLAIL